MILLKHQFLHYIFVLEDEPFFLNFSLSFFLVEDQLNFLLEGADFVLMFVFEKGQVCFTFRVLAFLPLFDFLLFEFFGLSLDLVGFHIILLSGELLLDFSEVEELRAFLEIFGFFATDILFC